ncbi:hypothetical protein LTR56_012547 [Elasticomyces elasticus]|nr:hypothetical protein LTR56_012547 [Elasticomyces elasticus]KAK3666270.1 hypothetical protein LTR22_002934 [Elasticomyces elasticus]KAK4926866.1 hypothetical protein LTR49_006282 [Elasticomyces elasticus]KAK5763702.1 hypothetical protein LTS12_006259 [Elasticomyces elasticus]
MTCQQIRRESAELFYTINTFSFSGSSMFSDHANLASRFLRGIGHQNTLAMRSILFDLDTIHSVYESTTDLTLMRDFANSKLQIEFRCIDLISLPNPPYAHKLDLDIRNLTASFANQRRRIRTHFKEVECPMEQPDPETATGEWENLYRLDQEFADGMVIWSRQEVASDLLNAGLASRIQRRTFWSFTTSPNMDNAPLSRIPAELRNRIYELVLFQPYPIFLTTRLKKNVTEPYYICTPSLATQHPMALTNTCVAIYREAIKLFYAVNTFEYEHSPNFGSSSTSPAYQFLEHIGHSNRLAICSLLFDVGGIYNAARSAEELRDMMNFAAHEPHTKIRCVGRVPLVNRPYAHALELDVRNLAISIEIEKQLVLKRMAEVEISTKQMENLDHVRHVLEEMKEGLVARSG